MKSKIFIAIYIVICLYTVFSRVSDWKDKYFIWDKACYHTYLPAIFIYQDLSHLAYTPYINKLYKADTDSNKFSLYTQPNGNVLNKYTVGLALFELPFFYAAHIYTLVSGSYPVDGFSLPYQYASIISTIFWAVVGLIYLRRLLRIYYSENTTTLVLLCIALGTNLFHYSAYDQGMSHTYSFMLFAALLYYTDAWYSKYVRTDAILIGLVLGLVTITRPVNITAVLIPLFWRIASFKDIRNRLALFNSRRMHIVSSIIAFLAIAALQLTYWKYITGNWLCYSYGNEGFIFTEPKVIEGLFGYRKGWFVYTPMAFVGIAGFIALYRTDRKIALPIIVYLCLMIYIVFSWWSWWYGGSFGARALIDYLPLLALPMAALFLKLHNRKWIVYPSFSLITALIILNIFQSYQYSKGIIDPERMTKKYYWSVICDTEPKPEKRAYLLSDEDYWNEMARINKVNSKKHF